MPEMKCREVITQVARNLRPIDDHYTEEADLLDDTRYLLDIAGAYTIRPEAGLRRGIPDLLVCFDGRFIGLELKDDIGEPSAQQLKNIKKIQKAGGRAGICRSLEDVIELLYGVD